jgi:hypothetical protein
MPDYFADQAKNDFAHVRFKAFRNRILSILSGQPTKLLAYDERKITPGRADLPRCKTG